MLMLTTVFTPWCLKSCSFSSCWCQHFENVVLTWREAETPVVAFCKGVKTLQRRTQLAVHIPTPNTAILLWTLQEEQKELLNSSPNALNKVMLTKTDSNSDTCGFTAHPSFLTAPFTPSPPSCPSDLLDPALSFWLSEEHQICWDISICSLVMGKHLMVKA